MNILDQIAAVKREEVKRQKDNRPLGLLERSKLFRLPRPSFRDALAKKKLPVIAEFKRQSPSRGVINSSASIRKIAPGYQEAGMAAISVLTDLQFFGGSSSDIETAAGLVDLPLLRKDFIIDEYQVVEARSTGASAILLIAALLSRQEADYLSLLAASLGMDVLFEIHDHEDLEKISDRMNIIGVNNRNLKTFEVSIRNSEDLLRFLPEQCIRVAESGISGVDDVIRLYEAGYNAFLIGEYFMKHEKPELAASLFMEEIKSQIA